jgi:poly(A) polymerase
MELSQSKITNYILPEIEKLKGVPQPIEYHHEGDVFTHTYLALKSLPEKAPLHLIWAVILHDIAKPQTLIREGDRIIFHDHAEASAQIAQNILRRLKFSNLEIKTISWIIGNHMKIGQIEKMRPTKRMAFLLDPRFEDLIKLTEADSKGTYPVNLSQVKELEMEMQAAKKEKEISAVKKASLKLITGDMLIKLGYNPSKEFKTILDTVNDKIIDGEIKNLDEAEKYIADNFKK